MEVTTSIQVNVARLNMESSNFIDGGLTTYVAGLMWTRT